MRRGRPASPTRSSKESQSMGMIGSDGSNAQLTGEDGAGPQLTIRRVRVEDAEAAAALSGQLGYEASGEDLRQRIERLAGCEQSQAVFVACLGAEGALAGWIEV